MTMMMMELKLPRSFHPQLGRVVSNLWPVKRPSRNPRPRFRDGFSTGTKRYTWQGYDTTTTLSSRISWLPLSTVKHANFSQFRLYCSGFHSWNINYTPRLDIVYSSLNRDSRASSLSGASNSIN